ncbi:unnamed protein product [Ceutorhynchus assimilis]|uniref:Protein msta n=1 Tax=Ceutorhynchus assimilis TaxID=467358 RepID=A0A9N9MQQ4_9CUCU|nr:unnamed protein product [Ceutorhynchus assimilis]
MSNLNKCNFCQNSAQQKCSGCQQIFYCSKEHQKLDWKCHKKNCQCFKITSNKEIGRFLSATRDIKPNEIILKEKPLIYGPAQETIPVCLGCNQEISTNNYRLCSKCQWPMCSEKCEANPSHLPECNFISKSKAKISPIPKHFYQCILVLRCLYQKQHNPSLWKKLNLLESHCKERQTTPGYYNEKVMATELIQKLFKMEFSLDEILKVCGIIMVNAHEVPLSEPPYVAIYEKTSMFENNCSSNCSKTFTEAGEILITSGVQIKKDDHLSICYADPLWNTTNRRMFLNETKFFWCTCKRCTDLTEFGSYFSAVSCQNKFDGGILLPTNDDENWICNKCNSTVPNLLVNSLLDKIGKEISDLDKNNVSKCKAFINKLKGILPSNNFHLVDVKLALSQLIGQTMGGLAQVSNEDLELKRSICEELIKLTETIIPSEKRVRGLLKFEHHASLAELARRSNKNNQQIKLILKESALNLQDCIELLKYEPKILPEGQICEQARKNMNDLSKFIIEK